MKKAQKILLFYALEALERTLETDEDNEIYFNYQNYLPCTSELKTLGDEAKLRILIDKTLSDLCR